MGREVRMVPPDWQHPKEWNSYRNEECYVPLHDGSDGAFAKADAEWAEGYAKWQEGLSWSYRDDDWRPKEPDQIGRQYTWWSGERPSPDHYMPDFPEGTATHVMMYEDTSEGTPISPAFATPEELARWLADNNASAFGGETATYDQWLSCCRRGFAVSAVMTSAGMQSGVAAMSDHDDA